MLQPSGRHPGPGGDPVWPRAGGGPDHEGRQDGRGIHHDQVHTGTNYKLTRTSVSDPDPDGSEFNGTQIRPHTVRRKLERLH